MTTQKVARHQWPGVIAAYRDRLPVTAETPVVSLREGGTPLLTAPVLSARTGCEVYLKVEGANPTGSFKDRGMTVAISMAAGSGAKAVICASTGNTSASAAAYAARAGLTCAVLVPRGKIAIGKLAQALVHGAKLLQVNGSFDDCLELARKLAAEYPVALVNSVNPDRLEGQKTAAFEIVDELGDAPDVHCLPVGNAGNITAYWMGYTEYQRAGLASRSPRMFGFQASGAAPIVIGRPVLQPQTIATAIRIGNPASWLLAEAARDESGGIIESVTDREILAAYRLLATREAVFGELASSASVAGLLKASASGQIPNGSRVVCTITGNGLKDPDWALSGAPGPGHHPRRRLRRRHRPGPDLNRPPPEMARMTGTVRVRVPATSANLGPGFDALGLALSLYDEVDAWVCESGLSIEISGEGADLAGAGEEHLVVRAMRAAFAATGGQPPGLGLRCVNRIPHGRGLGSSAAATVAGILAARALAPAGADALPDGALLGLATEFEGHPDNVAACLGGGLTIAWTADGLPRMVRLEPLASIRPVICVGPVPVRTERGQAAAARPGAAPGRGGHRRAQRAAGRRADAAVR